MEKVDSEVGHRVAKDPDRCVKREREHCDKKKGSSAGREGGEIQKKNEELKG